MSNNSCFPHERKRSGLTEKNTMRTILIAAASILFLASSSLLGAEEARFYDVNGHYQGRAHDDRIFNAKGEFQGRLRDGRIYDAKGRFVGRMIDTENQKRQSVYDNHGQYVGRVLTEERGNARIYNNHGEYMGRAVGQRPSTNP